MICKNCKQETHPAYIERYDGFCLDCSNAGVPDLLEQLETSRAWSAAWHTSASIWREECKSWKDRYALPETERYVELFTTIDLLQEEIKQLRNLDRIVTSEPAA